jgi:hypothetical protein
MAKIFRRTELLSTFCRPVLDEAPRSCPIILAGAMIARGILLVAGREPLRVSFLRFAAAVSGPRRMLLPPLRLTGATQKSGGNQ